MQKNVINKKSNLKNKQKKTYRSHYLKKKKKINEN